MKLLEFVRKTYCDKDGNPSSYRINMTIVIIFVCWLLGAMTQYIHACIAQKTPVDWLGLAAFLGAVTTLIGTIIYGKVQQTKQENLPTE